MHSTHMHITNHHACVCVCCMCMREIRRGGGLWLMTSFLVFYNGWIRFVLWGVAVEHHLMSSHPTLGPGNNAFPPTSPTLQKIHVCLGLIADFFFGGGLVSVQWSQVYLWVFCHPLNHPPCMLSSHISSALHFQTHRWTAQWTVRWPKF